MLIIKKSNLINYIVVAIGVLLIPFGGLGIFIIIGAALLIRKYNKYGIFVNGNIVIFQTAYRTSYFKIEDIVVVTSIRNKIIIKTTNSRHAMTRIKNISESVINLSNIVQNNKFDASFNK